MEDKLKDLKELIVFGLSMGMAVDKSLSDDGKITFADAANLIDPIMKAPAAFAGADKAIEALKNLGEEDKKELNAYVVANFDIADDKIEAVVEESVAIGVSAARIVSLLTKKEEAPTA